MTSILSAQPVFTPANLYGGQVWYDATQQAAGAVTSWADKFSNVGAATQGTGAQQPICTANQINGRNGLVFTGSSSQTLLIPSGINTLPTGDSTIFIVGKRATASGNTEIMTALGVTGTGTNREYLRFNTAEQIDGQNNIAGVPVSQACTTTTASIHRFRRSGTTQAVSVNNAAETINTSATNETGVDGSYIGSRLGTSQFLTGVIGEIIIYNRSLSTAEYIAVSQYLSQKWGIAIS